MKSLLILLAVVVLAQGEPARYDGYKVFRIYPKTEKQVQLVQQLESSNKFDVWAFNKKYADIMVSPSQIEDFGKILAGFHLHYEVFIGDVQKTINKTPLIAKGSKAIDWIDYHPLDHILEWLDELAAANPGVTTFEAGTSSEGRSIKGVRIALGADDAPSAFLEAGIHAREWISVATGTYVINELITSTDPKVRAVAEAFVWYIIPVFNPDGYDYTFTDDRIWRKNRQKDGSNFCIGIDMNRNWDFKWMQGGASNDPCAETYAGSAPNSAVEVEAVTQYIASIPNLKFYLDFHAYSQMLMFPYGYTESHLENYQEQYDVAEKSLVALTGMYGTDYIFGNIAETIYIASGSSVDWVKGNLGTRFSFVYELRDEGQYGFLLPPAQIIPTGQETMASIVVIAEESMRLDP